MPKGMDLFAFQVASLVAGLAVALPFYLQETMGGHPMPLSQQAALSIAYTGLIASALGFTCWNMGVIRTGPKTAGYLGNLYPVFGATLGILVLGEPFRWYHAVGAVVTLAGIWLATASPAVQPRAENRRA
jgi:drug/metabolite transporter (DMT)-like permease